MTQGILSVSQLVDKKDHRLLMAYKIQVHHGTTDEAQSLGGGLDF